MIKKLDNNERIRFMDGYNLYPRQYVLLGHVEHDKDDAIESGVPIAIGDDSDHNEIWNLNFELMSDERYGNLFLFYFGPIEMVGALL